MRLKELGSLLLLVTLAACSSGETAPDLSGSPQWVAENSPPYSVGELSAEPVVRLGALEGSAEVEFTSLVHVGVLRGGRIVVVDRGPNDIRWFDASGAFQYQAGGRGEGPGELQFPVSATLIAGDTLVVYDGRTQRLTAFDPSGSLVSTQPLRATSGFSVRVLNMGEGGLMAVEHRATFAMDGAEYNYTRDTLVLMIPSMLAETVDTVARLPGPESVTWVQYDGDQPVATRQMELPLGEVALAAPVSSGAVVVRPGEQGPSFYSREGEWVGQAVRSDTRPIPISEAIQDQYLAEAQAAVQAQAPGGVRPPPGVVERDVEARFALLADDQMVPAFDRILTAAEGRAVWLRRYVLPGTETQPSRWSIYGSDGSILAEVEIPPGFQPTHVTEDRVAGIETDGFGVEYATVYSFRIR